MNTQQDQNQTNKQGQVKPNPSRDIKYDEKEKDFTGEFEAAGEEVNPGEIDKSEVDLDRGSKEFSGGDENRGTGDAFDTAVKNAGSKGDIRGYEDNTPDVGMSSDLGGDRSFKQDQQKKDEDELRH